MIRVWGLGFRVDRALYQTTSQGLNCVSGSGQIGCLDALWMCGAMLSCGVSRLSWLLLESVGFRV